jgi:hypothetical protein
MAKNLDKALTDILDEPIDESIAVGYSMQDTDIRDEAEARDKHDRLAPAYTHMPTSDEQQEPMDKIVVAVQNHLINGDYDKATDLIHQCRTGRRKGEFFSQHHMNQLINWVRNIEKFTNMKDLSKIYYNYDDKGRMDDIETLKSKRVKEETLEKFMKDVEKVLRKKLKMR